MTPEEMARLHARAFDAAWDAAAFAQLLDEPSTLAKTAPGALLLARCVADEAEILTLATDPEARRQGFARHLLARFHAEAARRGAAHAFLEVAEDNAPARALYAAAGYAEAGRRPGYYRRADGARADALLLKRALP